MNPSRLKAYTLLLLATIIWALAAPVIKYVLGTLPPFTFLAYRFGLASIFAVGYSIVTHYRLPKSASTLFSLIIYAFITSTVSLGFLFVGLKDSTVLDISILDLILPLMISIAGVIFLKEHITTKEKVGMSIALLGSALIVIGPIVSDGANSQIMFTGNILLVIYLIVNTFSVILLKKLLRAQVDSMDIVNVTFIVGFLTTLPLAIYSHGFQSIVNQIVSLPVSMHLGVLYMAFLSGSLAYYLSNKATKTIEVGEAAVFNYLYPFISIPVAIVWLHESITPFFIVGGAITLVGVIIAEVKKKRVAS